METKNKFTNIKMKQPSAPIYIELPTIGGAKFYITEDFRNRETIDKRERDARKTIYKNINGNKYNR